MKTSNWKYTYCSAALLLGLSASATAQSGTYSNITEYSAESGGAITAGPDGALWFTGGNSIGRITTAGAITYYPTPTGNSGLEGITAGPDGALWFTEFFESKIGRITTAGVISEYPVPAGPWGITAGPDGALWFTEDTGIGRITTAGAITVYPTPRSGHNFGITAGPDGALWFTSWQSNAIGRITTSGVVTEGYAVGLSPYYIAAGADHALWFTSLYGGPISRITTSGVITQYPVTGGSPYGITAGPDGALWFADQSGNIGRITTAGIITEYPVRTTNGDLWLITAGPDGALWFTESLGIGRAPACGLGFSASFANSTLTMNFNLGIDVPATLNIVLHSSTGASEPFNQAIPAVVPPRAFTVNWNSFPANGNVTVAPQLAAAQGPPLCAEWTTVNTAQ